MNPKWRPWSASFRIVPLALLALVAPGACSAPSSATKDGAAERSSTSDGSGDQKGEGGGAGGQGEAAEGGMGGGAGSGDVAADKPAEAADLAPDLPADNVDASADDGLDVPVDVSVDLPADKPTSPDGAEASPDTCPPLVGAPNVGFGSATRGGLDGKVIKVTNLDDSGAGSLRAALAASGSRTIVFEVGGRIWLASNMWITNPEVTLAGETAPSPGITLENGGLFINARDVVVRHIRIRVGDDPSGPAADVRDALGIEGKSDGSKDVSNVAVDHVSLSWAVDENMSTWWPGVHDVTIRYSIIAEGLSYSLHTKDAEHSKGALVAPQHKRVSFIGNLFAHNNDRNPVLNGDATIEVLNNFIYDPGYFGVQINDYDMVGPLFVNVIGNHYRPGPTTVSGSSLLIVQKALAGTKLYMSDNISETGIVFATNSIDPRVSSLTDLGATWAARPAIEVEDFVLDHAGARPADRDSVDIRIVSEVRSKTGGLINCVAPDGSARCAKNGGGWPSYPSTSRPLAPPADPQGDADGDGRNNLEEWLGGYLRDVEGSAACGTGGP